MPRNSWRRRRRTRPAGRRTFSFLSAYGRRPTFEVLEERRLLAGDTNYFHTLADQVAGPSSALGTISAAMQNIDALASLPLINKPLSQVTQVTDTFNTFRTDLYNTIYNLDPSQSLTAVQTAIFDTLGPSGANLLVSKTSPAQPATLSDVQVTPEGSKIDVSIDIGFSSAQFSSDIGLGINSIPFKPAANTDGTFVIGLKYHDLDFGVDTATGTPFMNTNDATNELQLSLTGYLPNTFTAGLGFLNVSVTDNTPGTAAGDEDLSLVISSDVTGGLGAGDAPIAISSPQLSGNLNFNAHVVVQATGQGLPEVQTNMVLSWGLPNVDPSTALGASWGSPTLQFNDVQLNLGSFLGNLAAPIAQDIDSLIEPLKPMFDVLEKRIPGFSDISESLGGPQINLIEVDQLIKALPSSLPVPFASALNSIVNMRNEITTIDDLASAASGGWISIGNFNISGPNNSPLLSAAASILNDIGLNNWSSLISSGTPPSLNTIEQEIDQVLGSDVGDQVNQLLGQLTGSSSDGGLQFTYPIITDPGSVVLGLLLGQNAPMVTFSDEMNLPEGGDYPIPIIPGLDIDITATIDIDMKIDVGYDTLGLREAIEPLYAGGNFDANRVLDGFYIAPDTHFHVDATFKVGPEIDLLLASLKVQGGVTGQLNANIVNPAGRTDGIRPFRPGDLTGTLYSVSGSMDAVLTATASVGVDVPLAGFVGFQKTWTFADASLFKFTTDEIAVPSSLIPPPPTTAQLFSYDPTTKTLTLNAGLRAVDRGISEDVTNESFVITHVYHFSLAALPTDPLGGRIIFDQFVVSAFGQTQTLNAEVDHVVADMGDGDDSVTVYDTGTPTTYVIDGGDGDDTIDIEGGVVGNLFGGTGNDTIQAGVGSRFGATNIAPEDGVDTLLFGDGQLSNVIPQATFTIRADQGDPSIDQMTIDNSQSRVDTQYAFLPNAILAGVGLFNYALVISDVEDNSPVNRYFYFTYNNVVNIYSGAGNDTFLGTPLFSTLYGGDGDDTLDMNYLSPGVLPTNGLIADPEGQGSRFPSATFLGGNGTNTVTADDSATADGGYTLKQTTTQDASSEIDWFHADQTFILKVGGVTDTHLTVAPNNTVTVNGWAPGNLYLQAGAVDLNADDSMLWNTNLIITNTPDIFIVDSDTDPTISEAGINANGPFIDLLNGNVLQLNVDATASLFVFAVHDAEVDLTDALMAKPWHIGFLNGGGAGVTVVDSNANPTGYSYQLTDTNLEVNGTFSLPMIGITSLLIQGGDGNDSLDAVGDTSMSFITYFAGGGYNTFEADDTADTQSNDWVINPIEVEKGLGYTAQLKNVDEISVFGGSGDDDFLIYGSFGPLTVDGGGGNDNFEIGQGIFFASFVGQSFITGGDGNDIFTLSSVFDASALITGALTISGNGGSNSLVINDKSHTDTTYNIYADRILDVENDSTNWLDMIFAEFDSVEIDMGDGNDTAQIWGTSPTVTSGLLLDGNGGNDAFSVHPRDANGNQAIGGLLAINGGIGLDNVDIDNSASNVGEDYAISSGTSETTIRSPALAPVVLDDSLELIDLRGGSGDDHFNVQSFNASATQFNIEGNAGDDTVTLSARTENLFTTLTSAANLHFVGGAGIDSYIVDNSESIGSWSYTLIGAQVVVASSSEDYAQTINTNDFENVTIEGGSGDDSFFVETVGPGESVALDGNAGYDSFIVADESGITQFLQGQIIVDGGADGGSLGIDDSANTTGAQVHIDTTDDGTIGAAAGDTLFGAGGSLTYHNLSDSPSGDGGMGLALGSGADTVYAGPLASVSLFISGGGPITSPGDALHIALGGVLNPVQRTFGAGNGELDSSNRKHLNWANFEGLTTDYVPTPSFLVTNTLDSGTGSLRQAILDANASPNAGTPDVIRFDIPGAGTHTIQPLSALPTITDPVVIDGTTQPGYAGHPIIELNGTLAGDADGLFITAGNSTVRGLDIDQFVGGPNGLIGISGGGNNVIQSNYLGTNLAGNGIFPLATQGSYGVLVFGSSGNIIGTNGDGVNDTAEGNVISGNNTAGVLIESGAGSQTSNNNVIAGNLLGTSADGNSALPNGRMGVFLLSGTANRIGTNSDGVSDAAERNLISGNTEDGVYLSGPGNLVAGNLIGTNLAGTAAIPNGSGVVVQIAGNNQIGGTTPSAANVIANNLQDGVVINNSTGNSVLGNSIYNNGALGIDLTASTDGPNRVTANDPGDTDTGSNNLQNFPVITTALSTATQTILGGTLQSTPSTTFRVEFYANTSADPTGYGEGQTYLGSMSVTTDSTGMANFVNTLSTAVPAGQFISATATDPAGNTSEFALSVPVANSTSEPNVETLQVPSTHVPFLISSPAGTTINASISSTATAAPPSGLVFPFGFVTFTVTNVAPGAAISVILSGLDASQIAQYYKYGATPANHANHWYDFLYNHATDSDSATGTGMEIVNGTIVLHLIDGQRGDDDIARNGTITDIGGPVQDQPPVAKNDSASTLKNAPVTINVLSNDTDSDGTLNAGSVTIVAAPAHGTIAINPTSGAVTYTPGSNYTGSDSFTYKVKDNNGVYSNVATVALTVIPTGTISGVVDQDVTGNGATSDDTPLANVSLYLDTNNNGSWNTGEPTTTTASDGSYSFANLPAGKYVVRQVTPTGFIRTGPTTTDNYTINLAVGQISTGSNFDDAPLGNTATLSNVVFLINGVTPVSDLRGATHEGDTIEVSFTVAAGAAPERVTLVSYTAPSATYDPSTAAKQVIFDSDTGLFGPGTYTESVSNPHSYFQVDFVTGAAIDHLGPSGSNIFFASQNRLVSADNGGTHSVLTSPASLTGTVYLDANNNGLVDASERSIAGVTVTAKSGSTTQTVVTDMYGVYRFDNLPAGSYTITETQPSGYTDGKDTLGNKGGTAANDKFSSINLTAGTTATGYNFGEQLAVTATVAGNQTQTAAWWNSTTGQALIKALNGSQTSKNLGNWLATNFNNLFGASAGSANNLTGKTNVQVAAYYQSLYANAAKAPEADALALAFNLYVTNSVLAGSVAASYGFAVTSTGLGTATINVGVNGIAFGVSNNSVLTIGELVSRANAAARKGTLWDADGNGSLTPAESSLRNQVDTLFNAINKA